MSDLEWTFTTIALVSLVIGFLISSFKIIPEYPEFAWFEGLVNAVTPRLRSQWRPRSRDDVRRPHGDHKSG